MDDFRLAERKKELKPERLAWIREALAARSIVLIGLMGAGKTAVGRRLANRLELPFTDADSEIEIAAGQTVSGSFRVTNYREGTNDRIIVYYTVKSQLV